MQPRGSLEKAQPLAPRPRRRQNPASAALAAGIPAGAPQDRLLATAREMFCRDGIHATGIDRILAAAGVSKMTLYAHYGSKDGLLREVLLREGADWRTEFIARLEAAAEDPAGRLAAIPAALRAWFESGHFYGCAFMNAAAEHTKGEPWLRALAADHHRALLDGLGALAAAAGHAEPAILARQILLLIDGAIAALMVGGDPAVLDITARNLKAVLAAG
jgi:AcrR family transcriptional regulator